MSGLCSMLFRSLALGALVACGDPAATSGARFTLAARMDLETKTTTTRSNWNVELTRAQIAVGALHFFTGEPLGARYAPSRPKSVLAQVGRTLGEWVFIREAHAHPGHYVEGEALGELLTPVTIDLLAGSSPLGDADATSGLYRSARFTFAAPPSGALAAEMGDASLVLEGNATREGEQRHFLFRASASDLLNASQKPELEGCHFEERQVDGAGAVIVTAKPSVWFAAADFAELATDPNGAAVLVPKDSRLFRQIRERAIAAAGMDFRYAKE